MFSSDAKLTKKVKFEELQKDLASTKSTLEKTHLAAAQLEVRQSYVFGKRHQCTQRCKVEMPEYTQRNLVHPMRGHPVRFNTSQNIQKKSFHSA